MKEPRGGASDESAATTASEALEVRKAVAAVRRGNREAFGRIVERYERRLFGLALMMVRSPEAAEELAQDAFLRAFMHLDAYDDRRPFYPWLATIAVRLSHNWLRNHARTAGRETTPLEPDRAPVADADPLEETIADERARRLWRLVAALPSAQRTAVYHHYRQELRVDDVARALGVTSGTVKTLLFRARRRLREAMTDEEPWSEEARPT